MGADHGLELPEVGRAVFLEDVRPRVTAARVAALLLEVVRGAAWRDAAGERAVVPDATSWEATTFGEAVTRWAVAALGPCEVRYPAPGAQRGSGLRLRDPGGAVAVVDDLTAALVALAEPDAATVAQTLAMAAAAAAWPDDTFQWTGAAVARRWRVVGEVERWPGEIQLQAARLYRPELRVGDTMWLSDRERLPACWVLDLLADP